MRLTLTLTMPIAILLSPWVCAKNVSIDLSAAMGESNNALKTSQDKISEKQNRYAASVKGDWINQWLAANVQYGATRETFSDDSQQSEGYLQGDSSIKLGTVQSILNLDLRHSRRTLLQDVSEAPSTDNQEEREIVSVIPSAHFQINGSNDVRLFSDLSRTRYLETETRDADRKTYGLEYSHDFSAVDNIRLNAKKTKSEFLYFPLANYTLNSASVVYQVSLRQLTYSVGAGRDQTEMEIADSASIPHYEASLGYKSGANRFRIYVDQSMTDSSLGQGLDMAVSDLPGVDAVSTNIGLIKRRSGGLEFNTVAVCARCDLALTLTHSKDVYVDTDSESTQKGASLNFRYTFSPHAQALIAHSMTNQEPLLGLATDKFRQSLTRVSFQYKFMLDLSLEIFTEKEKRSSDSALQDYAENFTGLALAYHFE